MQKSMRMKRIQKLSIGNTDITPNFILKHIHIPQAFVQDIIQFIGTARIAHGQQQHPARCKECIEALQISNHILKRKLIQITAR